MTENIFENLHFPAKTSNFQAFISSFQSFEKDEGDAHWRRKEERETHISFISEAVSRKNPQAEMHLHRSRRLWMKPICIHELGERRRWAEGSDFSSKIITSLL